ncbi:3-hydroxyisobutyrate dehydrogenase [Selenomonas ruminantium]|uniref:3-hydroxyisobutyrate dehydrogenase n=1 Tax=Selenomonas ruminantium TaxID=971 RepID=A0A1I3DQC5_SELRU|nr:3-hydroxyisobutyrate dehydrogenase [Selenomonas ruminantium]
MSIENIGFIGTGIMGAAMAGHLLAAGFKVSVYNRTKSKAEGLIAQGAKWCESPGACARGQDVVITIVGYPKDVEEVYLGADGVLANAKAGAYVVDMTTSSPILAEKIYVAAREKGIHGVDAPVTGGDTGAKNASLSILVGGDESSFQALKPVFAVLGKNLVYMGSAGAGQKAKACNQIAIAGALAGACEAYAYAKASGIDLEKTYQAISAGAAGSFQMSNVVRRGLNGDFEPGFMLKHFGKDLAIGTETSAAYGAALPVLAQVLGEVRQMERLGEGDKGTQSLLHYYGIKA